jgi:hypothetical protein
VESDEEELIRLTKLIEEDNVFTEAINRKEDLLESDSKIAEELQKTEIFLFTIMIRELYFIVKIVTGWFYKKALRLSQFS